MATGHDLNGGAGDATKCKTEVQYSYLMSKSVLPL